MNSREDMKIEENNKQLAAFLKEKLRHWNAYGLTLAKWLLFALVVGLTVGVAGALFHKAIDWGTEFREGHGWVLFLLPLAGLLIVFAYRITGMSDDKGTEYIIGAVREGRILRIRTAPLIFFSTVLTHLTGGSAGREGAALQLGGSMVQFYWTVAAFG